MSKLKNVGPNKTYDDLVLEALEGNVAMTSKDVMATLVSTYGRRAIGRYGVDKALRRLAKNGRICSHKIGRVNHYSDTVALLESPEASQGLHKKAKDEETLESVAEQIGAFLSRYSITVEAFGKSDHIEMKIPKETAKEFLLLLKNRIK